MRTLTLLLALGLGLPALAQEEKRPLLERRDADGDGRLSPAEFGDREIFELLDRDGDGFVTAEELPKPRRGGKASAEGDSRAERLLKRHDADGDGKLGPGEWPISRLPLAEADRNGDGFADLEEIRAVVGARPGTGADRPPDPPRPGGPGPDGPPDEARLREMAQGLFQRLDRNGDGLLGADELPRDGRLDLAKADRNGDGAVDLLELTLVLTERTGGEPPLRRLKQLDANQDGVIEAAEWKGPREMFAKLDADGDGRITDEEARKAAQAMGGGRWSERPGDAAFRRFDADEDGRITAAEWKGSPEAFKTLDANGDGAITREEITPRGPQGGRRGRAPDLRSGKDSAQFLADYDKNRDGQVSREEFPHERRFAEIDADGDGVLSADEIGDAMDRVRNEEEFDLFERYDLDGDGRITRQEFTGPAATFERLDRNHDGMIDRGDL
jgi:Ca2+-binding EF-hand superfamily protein